ncbi:MAG: T9SS type A sorting domain-containing protein [Candidatus Cloacimonetes bacterium]|nr:T9SS type A sorting domain-containing protein [Candidatus Cloacimonadota bacterium]
MKKKLLILVLLTSFNLWGTLGFVVNSGSGTLSKIDFETGEVNNAFCSLGFSANRVALTDDFAYVVNSGDNNLQKIDIETGATVSYIFIETSSNPYDITIEGNYAYVSGGLSNKVYKVNLGTEVVENTVTVGGNPAGIVVFNNKLYVGNTDYASGYANCSVSVIDLISFDVEVTVPVEVNPQFLAVINENIHVSCGGNWSTVFGKICILDPATNMVTNTLDIGGVTSNLAMTPNNVVYVADGYSTALYAYNGVSLDIIYDNTNPFTPGGTMVAANDEFFSVLGGEWGQNFTVRTYNFNEVFMDEYVVGLYATDIKLYNEETLSGNEELSIRKYELFNFPNPFNPLTTITFSVTQTSSFVTLEIYNLKGQKVKQLLSNSASQLSAGQHSVTWNGTDDNSRPVGSGIYFYSLKLDGKTVDIKKMILMK